MRPATKIQPGEPNCEVARDRSRPGRDAAVALALGLALVAVYNANGEVLPGNDATPNVYLAASILDEGRMSFVPSLSPWLFDWELRTPTGAQRARVSDLSAPDAAALYARGLLVPRSPYYLNRSVRLDESTRESSYVGVFGPGAALSAVAVLAPLRAVAGPLQHHPDVLWFGAKLAASLFVAASASLVFLTARRWLARAPALGLAIAYGIATSVWSTSSQALWQHAPNELFLALGMYGLALGGRRGAALAGAGLAAATACRPTSAVFAVAAAVSLLFVNRRGLVGYACGALPIALAMAAYNSFFLGSPLAFGQTAAAAEIALSKTGSPDPWQTPLWEGLAGLLVSPSRGLLVFSPWLVLGVAGAVVAWRRTAYAPLRPLTIAVAVVAATQAKWFDWWGGWSFGCRPLVDLSTVLAVLAIPVVDWALATRRRIAVVAVLVGWSVLVQVVGAFAYDLDGWNARLVYRVMLPSGELTEVDASNAATVVERGGRPVETISMDIDAPQYRGRLWSVTDNEIGYYLMRFPASISSKAAASRRWVEGWRMPSPPPR